MTLIKTDSWRKKYWTGEFVEKKKLFVMPPAETETPEKIGDKESMEKSNI